MRKSKCIHPRKVERFMKEFADKAILDTGTDLIKTHFKYKGYFAAMLYGYYPHGIADIVYGFEDLQDDSQKQFRKDFVSRCKIAKGFADITLDILHEIGHFATEEVSRSYDRRQAILKLYRDFPQAVINFKYFGLPDEKAATDWAIDWLSISDHRKIAKDFEKKFFSCFEKPS